MKKIVIPVVVIALVAVGYLSLRIAGNMVAEKKLAEIMGKLGFSQSEYSYESLSYCLLNGSGTIEGLSVKAEDTDFEASVTSAIVKGFDKSNYIERLEMNGFSMYSADYYRDSYDVTMESFILNGFDASMLSEYENMNTEDAYVAGMFSPFFSLKDVEIKGFEMDGGHNKLITIGKAKIEGPIKMKQVPEKVNFMLRDLVVDAGIMKVEVPTLDQKRTFNKDSLEYSENLTVDVTDIGNFEYSFLLEDFDPEAIMEAQEMGDEIKDLILLRDFTFRMQDEGVVDMLLTIMASFRGSFDPELNLREVFVQELQKPESPFTDPAVIEALVEFFQKPGSLELVKGDAKPVSLYDLTEYFEETFNQLNLMMSVNGKAHVSLQTYDE